MIKSITLAQFKKHENLKIETNEKLILIHGNNASGKTSVLEAISLFSPGSGLFNTKLDEAISFKEHAFEVYLDSFFNMQLTYHRDQKKQIKINNVEAKAMQMQEYILIYGLNPYLAFAFWKDSTIRRKHVDRLIMQNDLRYAPLFAKYTKILIERNKLIELQAFNEHYIKIYNPMLAEIGMQITEIREKVLNGLNEKQSDYIKEFLGSNIILTMSPTYQEQQKIFQKALDLNFIGPHKTKFTLSTNEYSGTWASTGQQKKLLIALTIAALPENEASSVLLLDDLFSNLDEFAIKQLLAILSKQHFQTFITNIEDIDTEHNIKKIKLE